MIVPLGSHRKIHPGTRSHGASAGALEARKRCLSGKSHGGFRSLSAMVPDLSVHLDARCWECTTRGADSATRTLRRELY
jgi:hypothetical protein